MTERESISRGRKRNDGRGRAGSTATVGSGGRQRLGELAPRVAPREDLGQVQHDAPDRPFDPDCDLQEPLAQRPDLRRAETRGALRTSTIGADNLQLTQYDERGWRATFYTTGMEHSPTSATGTAWERRPWRAVQAAAWEALTKGDER